MKLHLQILTWRTVQQRQFHITDRSMDDIPPSQCELLHFVNGIPGRRWAKSCQLMDSWFAWTFILYILHLMVQHISNIPNLHKILLGHAAPPQHVGPWSNWSTRSGMWFHHAPSFGKSLVTSPVWVFWCPARILPFSKCFTRVLPFRTGWMWTLAGVVKKSIFGIRALLKKFNCWDMAWIWR